MKFSEEQLKQFALPLGVTEDQMCKNAINIIRDALKELGFSDNGKEITRMFQDTYAYEIQMSKHGRTVKLFIQGSYANNTNVRAESDVDIAVIQEEVFHAEYRSGVSDSNYGFSKAPRPAKSFKDEVEEALKRKFVSGVERKDKSIKIHGNSYRTDADTVPCKRYKDFRKDYWNDSNNYVGGVVIESDSGERLINYPEEHIKKGKEKNVATNRCYKKMVRIMKKMRYLMKDAHYMSASEVSSFGLESLLWNIPDNSFNKYANLGFNFEEIVAYLVKNISTIKHYKEANGIKPLFNNESDSVQYESFITDLNDFYRYSV